MAIARPSAANTTSTAAKGCGRGSGTADQTTADLGRTGTAVVVGAISYSVVGRTVDAAGLPLSPATARAATATAATAARRRHRHQATSAGAKRRGSGAAALRPSLRLRPSSRHPRRLSAGKASLDVPRHASRDVFCVLLFLMQLQLQCPGHGGFHLRVVADPGRLLWKKFGQQGYAAATGACAPSSGWGERVPVARRPALRAIVWSGVLKIRLDGVVRGNPCPSEHHSPRRTRRMSRKCRSLPLSLPPQHALILGARHPSRITF